MIYEIERRYTNTLHQYKGSVAYYEIYEHDKAEERTGESSVRCSLIAQGYGILLKSKIFSMKNNS